MIWKEFMPHLKTFNMLDAMRPLQKENTSKYKSTKKSHTQRKLKQAYRHRYRWMHFRSILRGRFLHIRKVLNESQQVFGKQVAQETDEALEDMWEKLKYFRIGSKGRKCRHTYASRPNTQQKYTACTKRQ